jgi:poly(A) polymerase
MLRLAEWWEVFQTATPAVQKAMLSTLGEDPAPRRTRQRKPRRKAPPKEGA